MLTQYNQSTEDLLSRLMLNRSVVPSNGGIPLRTALVRHTVETTYVVPGDWPKADGEAWFHDGAAPAAGSDAQFLIDGRQTFDAMLDAMETANKQGHYIILLGWGLDVDFAMAKGKSFLQIVEERASLKVAVRVLLWENPRNPKIFVAMTKLNSLRTVKSLDVFCCLDDNTKTPVVPRLSGLNDYLIGRSGNPGVHTLGSHHQKILLVYGDDGLVGFCGGVDLDENRLGILHDVHVRVTGDAPKELLKIAEQRWANAKNDDAPPTPSTVSTLSPPAFPTPPRAPYLARVMQTVGNPDISGIPNTVWPAVLRGIHRASKCIYIEDQYFWSLDLIHALIDASTRVKQITIVLPDVMTTEYPLLVQRALHELVEKGGAGIEQRVGIFAHKRDAHAWVHAKLFVFDDEYAIVGTANANNRGYFHDSEVTVGIAERAWSKPEGARAGKWFALQANFARRMRIKLWAEHLGLSPDELFDALGAGAHWESPLPPGAAIGVFEAVDFRSREVLQADFDKEFKAWGAGGFVAPQPREPWGRLPWWEAPYKDWYPAEATATTQVVHLPFGVDIPIPLLLPNPEPYTTFAIDPKPILE
jgi:phosphatidylserine/phosphatidylglycerophosphate/cardiolipin synthase-like enzyme